ncbi:type III secretion system chaperone [Pseudomonas sp. GD03842]|uniref:type III secretion system chaperone n=1 Tax=Pseudomonas sp. GD03842 TaxID=2975385 RepID=UPI002449A7DC|nr:type III secretion system chaperone [Pseudomonas sp. GD03842]MDH0747136.1 type III secretion system chaperone [Pseudomonas sp. GD03842]
MSTPDTLLAALGRHLNTELGLENGVCALFDQDREVAIIEMPPAGDVAVLHCKLPLRSTPDTYEHLLRLNFDTDALHGCWLALDPRNDLRLCTHMALQGLSEAAFVHGVQGFIRQAREMPHLLKTVTPPKRSAMPGLARSL